MCKCVCVCLFVCVCVCVYYVYLECPGFRSHKLYSVPVVQQVAQPLGGFLLCCAALAAYLNQEGRNVLGYFAVLERWLERWLERCLVALYAVPAPTPPFCAQRVHTRVRDRSPPFSLSPANGRPAACFFPLVA